MKKSLNLKRFSLRDVSLFSGVGEVHYFGGGGSQFFFLLSGEGSQFFQGFLREGHIFLKYFIEKINYEYPAAAGFRFLLVLPLPSTKRSISI